MSPTLGFCTVSTVSHLSQCRVLAESVSREHPGSRLRVLVADDVDHVYRDASEPFDVMDVEALDLQPAEFRRMAACYEPLELLCALKPWAMKHELDVGARAVVYLDNDTEVFAPLTEFAETAEERGVALVAHISDPLPRDGLNPVDTEFLRFGTYNGGCIAVGGSKKGRRFLRWWSERLSRDCIYSDEEGLYCDQRWLDLVPAIFEAALSRDPGLNVAYWNRAHMLVSTRGEYRVGGAPLRLFHFSGFDPTRPRFLSTLHTVAPRADPAANPALGRLCSDYASRVLAEGYSELKERTYGYARTETGLRLDRRMRRLYRAELLKADRGQSHYPPDPYTSEGAVAFGDWLKDTPLGDPVSRYLGAVYSDRPDVRGKFPVLSGTDRELFLAWVAEFGVTDAGIPCEFAPANSETSPAPRPGGLYAASVRLKRKLVRSRGR